MLAFLTWTCATVATAGASEVDSSVTRSPALERALLAVPFDTIDVHEYAARRSFSLDQFLESQSGYLIDRLGPIGAQASYSRFGMGRARGLVYLGGVLLNDPQDGRAPLALVPVTSIRQLVFGSGGRRVFSTQGSIEGAIQIVEPRELPADPTAVIDLSKGDHRIKQRRAMYSSPRKPAGLDFGYDELRNGGYAFDARQLENGTAYGSSTTRVLDAELRGVFPSGEAYRFSLKRFQTSFLGDTADASADHRRHGYIAAMATSVENLAVDLFGRSYTVSTPDSVTMNQTTSIALGAPLIDADSRRVVVGAGYEDIRARQEINGSSANDRLEKAWASFSAASAFGGHTVIEIAADLSHQLELAWGWGARVAAARNVGKSHRVIAEARRGYRLPNLGELFLPLHQVKGSSTDAVGNRELKSESSLEASLSVMSAVGPLKNELRATVIRAQEPILPVATGSLVKPTNADAQDAQMFEDRLSLHDTIIGLELAVSGGVLVGAGDLNGYFEGVPWSRLVVAGAFGRSLFKNTSHILVGGEYQHNSSRTVGGVRLDPYDVVNLKIEGKLIDAHIYVMWFNVVDEAYETRWPYLMTPRTLAYGIAWTFYN
jgi:hypothetical protein